MSGLSLGGVAFLLVIVVSTLALVLGYFWDAMIRKD
jgi:hypothetical protein